MNARKLPVVTVITVCFNLLKNNREACFSQCLESVNSQDYPEVEHLVIDGGSQDGTVEVLAHYAERGWIRYISEPDSGIYDAMNKGIRLAKGKYIAFLNSDDFWHRRDAVSASVEALERSDAAFSYAPRTIVNEDGSFRCTETADPGVFPCIMPFCHQTMFTRIDVLRRLGNFDAEHYRSAADYDLVCRILLSGERGVYVPLNFTSFRLGGFSVADDALSGGECQQIRSRLLGSEAASLLNRGQMNDDLLQRIMELVHPRVCMAIMRCFTPVSPGLFCLTHGLSRQPSGTAVAPAACCCVQKKYLLLGAVPILRIKTKASRTDFFLFGILPLLRIRNKKDRRIYYAFFILPLLLMQYR